MQGLPKADHAAKTRVDMAKWQEAKVRTGVTKRRA
jgi:hypothetical protein